ncbi:MAG: hypothetical protein HY663_04140 [Chloroflexi bacterium]|nr:hypothetical protein [Chloroflexota bacterium]
MRRVYLPAISMVLLALLALAGCAPGWGWGGQGGMMGGQGSMMGGQGSMMGGQGGMMGYYTGIPVALSHDQAQVIAGRYFASTGNPDLKIGEFEEYSHNFYLSLIEKSTGRGAMELIIDRYSGSYQPEPQTMMWNSKYGMMGSYQSAQMTVTPEQALKTAQDFLDVAYPGTKADEVVSYYGYYTIMTTLQGKHYGMLSINSYSGEVWYHTWHGLFISEIATNAQ